MCDGSRGRRFAISSLIMSTMGSDITHVLFLCLNTIPVKFCLIDFIDVLYMADNSLRPYVVKRIKIDCQERK